MKAFNMLIKPQNNNFIEIKKHGLNTVGYCKDELQFDLLEKMLEASFLVFKPDFEISSKDIIVDSYLGLRIGGNYDEFLDMTEKESKKKPFVNFNESINMSKGVVNIGENKYLNNIISVHVDNMYVELSQRMKFGLNKFFPELFKIGSSNFRLSSDIYIRNPFSKTLSIAVVPLAYNVKDYFAKKNDSLDLYLAKKEFDLYREEIFDETKLFDLNDFRKFNDNGLVFAPDYSLLDRVKNVSTRVI
ncbi:hypothetical protein K9L67_01455 [Candidatus Woesearchaeota archaeon]|nr:hypothetical protein [Candidatus Woesearchaeota archaeon]MCF7900870.1 hypothetical protein [Candidatus Woesearchaeota archaeon]MCF8013885.1 hypothetical protein [Candidatus Woesearchaeota archaeon]